MQKKHIVLFRYEGPQPGNWFLGWAKLITHYRDQWRITQHWDLQALRCFVQKGRPAVSSDHQHTGYRAPTWAVSPWGWWWELMERAWNVSHHAASFGVTSILAISCPYSRAEHIPCQNSWEISGNCEDPFQVKFVFHTVCHVLLFFWHVRCRLHMFFPKDDPYFQQFLEMS